jgi:hypothetical protein
MSFLSRQNPFTKISIAAALLLLAYGYCAKIFHIYFFWESQFIGWMVAFVAAIAVLADTIRQRKRLKKSLTVPYIFIVVLAFILAIECLLLIVLPRTDAFVAADQYFKTDSTVSRELGRVRASVVLPVGTINVSSSNDITTGDASLQVIVKGDKKFREYDVHVIKTAESDRWVVVNAH